MSYKCKCQWDCGLFGKIKAAMSREFRQQQAEETRSNILSTLDAKVTVLGDFSDYEESSSEENTPNVVL